MADQEPKASKMVYAASFAALLGALTVGSAIGYTGPAFDDMTTRNETEIFDQDNKLSRKGIIGSALAIGALIGGLLTQPANTYLGHRWSLIYCGIPFALSWLMISTAHGLTMMVMGRIVGGLCSGIICGVAPTYVVEISPPKIRGALGTCFQVMITVGILAQAIFVTLMDWRWMAGINVAFALSMSILMLLMSDTPQWLLSKNRNEEAEESLKRFRVGQITQEFAIISQTAQEGLNQQQSGNHTISQLINSLGFYKPLILSLALMFFQQFSGINAILFNQTDIYRDAVPDIDAKKMTIIVCIAQVIATIVGSFLVDLSGRRVLLLLSGIGHATSLIMFGFYRYLSLENKTFEKNNSWFALLSMIIFITSFSIGYGPIPWMMVPELAGSQVRSLIASISTSFNWICVFIVAISTEPLKVAIGDYYTYWLYALICAFSCVFVQFYLPETKGKTNEQIQRELLGLQHNNNNNNDDTQSSIPTGNQMKAFA